MKRVRPDEATLFNENFLFFSVDRRRGCESVNHAACSCRRICSWHTQKPSEDRKTSTVIMTTTRPKFNPAITIMYLTIHLTLSLSQVPGDYIYRHFETRTRSQSKSPETTTNSHHLPPRTYYLSSSPSITIELSAAGLTEPNSREHTPTHPRRSGGQAKSSWSPP